MYTQRNATAPSRNREWDPCNRTCWVYPQLQYPKSNLSAGFTRLHFNLEKRDILCKRTDGYKIILCDNSDIVELVEMILVFCVNIVLFSLIASNNRLRANKSNKFFLNLQVSHIILSLSGFLSVFYPGPGNKIEIIVNNGVLMEMFFSLVITTCDRYIAIEYPFEYKTLTTKKTLLIIACSWITPTAFVIFGLTLNIQQKQCTVVSTTVMAVAIFVLTSSNFKIYLIAKRQVKAITSKKESKVLKSTYVCLAIVLSFVTLWFPYFIHNMMVLVGIYKAGHNLIFTRIVVQVAILNSLLDPILFVVFRKDVKKELRRLVRRRKYLRQFSIQRKSGSLQSKNK